MRALLAALVLLAGGAIAQTGMPNAAAPIVIERAEFLASDSPRLPPDDAPWQAISLPDDWHLTRPGYTGGVWYRIELPITSRPPRIHGIYLPRDSASAIRLMLNGAFAGGTRRPDQVVRLNHQPFLMGAPAPMFRDGRNVLHLYVEGRSELHHGLTRVWVGDTIELRALWLEKYRLHVLLVIAFAFVVLAAGLVALIVWARTRSDPALFWFGTSAALLGVPTIAGFAIAPGPQGPWLDAWQLFQAYAYAPALALGALHTVGRATRAQAMLLWAALAAGFAVPLALGKSALAGAYPWVGALSIAVLAACFLLMISRGRERSAIARGTAAVALLAAAALTAHDIAIWMGWIDFDRLALQPFAAPVLTLSLGVLLVARHLDAVRGMAEAKATLEQRVAERTAEIERAHEHLRALENEQAVVRERQRIMADMHDGLGASLVGLLGAVQAGSADRGELERRAHAALQELRLAVDSLDTPPGDLNMALGTVRHRLRDPIEASGVALEWQVGELPHLAHLTPSRILHVQRILLEALTNALRHAKARTVAVAARVDPGAAAVEVSVADDGRGLERGGEGGRGLMIMQRRASALGGSLQVESVRGSGTRVTLRIPLAGQVA